MKQPYLLGQIGLVGNALKSPDTAHFRSPYLLGQIGLVGNPPITFKKSRKFSLPIRSNRISWKPNCLSRWRRRVAQPLPIRSNRISWKQMESRKHTRLGLPYLLGQIGLVGNWVTVCQMAVSMRPLPIRSNRISWKQILNLDHDPLWARNPYLLGQIGLVGNRSWRWHGSYSTDVLTY